MSDENLERRRKQAQQSFRDFLGRACDWVNPRLIVEWGPGASTALMSKWCPAATILSIEHHPKWMGKAKASLGVGREVSKDMHGHVAMRSGRSTILLMERAISMKGGQSQGYATWPLYLKGVKARGIPGLEEGFDLAFVDGRLRFDCLVVCKQVLSPGGVVVLHDADRPNYRRAWGLFAHKHFDKATRTAVLSDAPMPFIADRSETWCRQTSESDTLAELKGRLGREEPFYFVRFGDADMFFIDDPKFNQNRRHQPKTPKFSEELAEAFSIDDPRYMIALAASGWTKGKDRTIIRIASAFWRRREFWNAVALHGAFLSDLAGFEDFVGAFKDRDVCMVGGKTPCGSELVRKVFNVREVVSFPDTNAYDVLDGKMDEVRAVVGRHRTVVSALGQATRILAKRLWKEGIRNLQYFDVGSTVDALAGVQTRGWILKNREVVSANCARLARN